MLDDLLVLGPSVKDSYHFQIVPVFLSIVGRDYVLPAQGTTYRFSVHKGKRRLIQDIISSMKTDTQFRLTLLPITVRPQCRSPPAN